MVACTKLTSLLLLALAVPHAAAAGPLEDLCKAVGPFTPMKDIRTEQFCLTSQMDSNQRKCALLDAMEAGLIKAYESGGGAAGGCKADSQTPAADKSLTGTSLPFALSNQRPLPDSLPGSLMGSEGGVYYWLFRNLLNFNLWASCAATGSAQSVTPGTPKTPGKDWVVPAGWSVHSTLWQPNGGGMYWPFATIASRGSEVVLLVRGSQTEYDWKADFDYTTTSASLGSIPLPGRVHQGFARVAASLWPGVQAALQSLSATSKITNVYIAGHSLGAGASTLLAYGTQSYLDDSGIKAKVDALLYAPPNAGDSTFAAAFGAKVNARRMPFVHDVVPQVPCSPTMVGCPRAPIPSGGVKTWSYSPVPGTLALQPSGMPQQSVAWSHFNKIFPCHMPAFFQATHVCAYGCYLSQYAKDGNTMCKLWDKEGEGSFCPGYPHSDGPRQYPYIIG